MRPMLVPTAADERNSGATRLTLVQLEDGVGHGWKQSFSFQDVDVPDPEGECERCLHKTRAGHTMTLQ